jgi:hypothetical protein
MPVWVWASYLFVGCDCCHGSGMAPHLLALLLPTLVVTWLAGESAASKLHHKLHISLHIRAHQSTQTHTPCGTPLSLFPPPSLGACCQLRACMQLAGLGPAAQEPSCHALLYWCTVVLPCWAVHTMCIGPEHRLLGCISNARGPWS